MKRIENKCIIKKVLVVDIGGKTREALWCFLRTPYVLCKLFTLPSSSCNFHMDLKLSPFRPQKIRKPLCRLGPSAHTLLYIKTTWRPLSFTLRCHWCLGLGLFLLPFFFFFNLSQLWSQFSYIQADTGFFSFLLSSSFLLRLLVSCFSFLKTELRWWAKEK